MLSIDSNVILVFPNEPAARKAASDLLQQLQPQYPRLADWNTEVISNETLGLKPKFCIYTVYYQGQMVLKVRSYDSRSELSVSPMWRQRITELLQ
jgi:hypothetical protein